MEQIFKDAYAHIEDDVLIVGNMLIERRWLIKDGLLYNLSLLDKITATEWLVSPSKIPSPYPEAQIPEPLQDWKIEARMDQNVCVEEPYLFVQMLNRYKIGEIAFRVKIYPESSAVTTSLFVRGLVAAPLTSRERNKATTGIEDISDQVERAEITDLQEYFHLPHVHHYLTQISLLDDTDVHDNLVHKTPFLLTNFPEVKLQGNLFRHENRLTGNGLIFLKEAPLPYARPVKTDYDLIIKRGSQFYFKGLGAGNESARYSYPLTTLVYNNGESGFIGSLQSYQRCFRRYRPEKDEVIWHSIWGDRNQDGQVCEEFYKKEIKKALEIGIDHLYFIDGWQKGASSNSVIAGGVWENQWAQDDYWDYNLKRFPNGLTALTTQAASAGCKIGMWYNPDQTDDYINWQRDVELILQRVKELGLTNVKFDGVVFYTKKGEENLLRIMREVVQRTNGEVSIEIDISAGLRTGYYQGMSYGFLFLENRYTDWRRYYPYTTLRNLWQLAKYVDPRRLRIEVLNGKRNAHLYQNDPLAPSHYRADYLFAITMVANPLAWFEATGLGEEFTKDLRDIINIYKPVREAIHSCQIYPIGKEPDGFSWSGFQAHNFKDENGFIIVFRDNSPDSKGVFRLNHLISGYEFELLAGDGRKQIYDHQNNCFCVEIENTRRFAFYRYKNKKHISKSCNNN